MISSEIEIDTQSTQPVSNIESNQRLRTATALVDLLRNAGLDCHLVAPEGDDSTQSRTCDADESVPRRTAKTSLQ